MFPYKYNFAFAFDKVNATSNPGLHLSLSLTVHSKNTLHVMYGGASLSSPSGYERQEVSTEGALW